MGSIWEILCISAGVLLVVADVFLAFYILTEDIRIARYHRQKNKEVE